MQFDHVSVPEVYRESSDFRLLMNWFNLALTKVKFDTENLFDLYDPLRCPENLLWMLADTIGYKYDNRLPTAFNRLVLLYFMSMIRTRGSNDGVTLAAETNLAQFDLDTVANKGYTDASGNRIPPKDILNSRLENTSIPVNSVYVTPHTSEGYIEVVYFSSKLPIDACIEYVRPLGMYLFQSAGVRLDGRTKISVDARLTNINDANISMGATHVGHYRREDYTRMQKTLDQTLPSKGMISGYTVQPLHKWKQVEYQDPLSGEIRYRYEVESTTYQIISSDGKTVVKSGYSTQTEALADIPNYDQINPEHVRNAVYYRNSSYEKTPNEKINPGYRSLYSLQLANNEHIIQSLIDPIFSLGYGPQSVDDTYDDRKYITENDVEVINPDYYLKPLYVDKPIGKPSYPDTMAWNLRYNKSLEEQVDQGEAYTIDSARSTDILNPRPAVNPIMTKLGDAISMNTNNTIYTKVVSNEAGNNEIHTIDTVSGKRVIGYNEDGTPIFE